MALSYTPSKGIRKYCIISFFIAFLLFLPNLVYAQISKPDTMVAYPFSIHSQEKISLDGKLDEVLWQKAIRITNFTQRNLVEGEPATERTEVAVLYDEENLYFGIWSYDSYPEKIVAFEQRRDFSWWREDNFNIILDTYHDKRNGYLFVTNPNGARADALIIDNGVGFNVDWNGVWDAASTRTEFGWFAEIKIPFTTLKFSEQEEQIWGINFERNIRHKREQVQWQGWARDASIEQLNRAGTLVNLRGLKSTNLLELKPYLLSGVQQESNKSIDWQRNIGADLNYLFTPTLKLNLTANTDFAQVEADQAQINFTRFPLFFPEKREFFLEGRDYFDFGTDALGFYSRRIGLSDNGLPIPILAGARLLGKAGSTTLGVISMQTAAQDTQRSVNYGAYSFRQDIFDQSRVGVIATSKIESNRQNYVYGLNTRLATDQFLGNKNLVFESAFAQSYTSDSTNKIGNTFNFGIRYPNDLISMRADFSKLDSRFNPEVGFVGRNNYKSALFACDINPRPNIDGIQQIFFTPLFANFFWNDLTGARESAVLAGSPFGIQLNSGDSFWVWIEHQTDIPPEDFPLGRNILIQAGEYNFTRYELNAETFDGRWVSGYGGVSWGDYYGGTRLNFNVGTSFRLSRFITFDFEYQHNELRFESGKIFTNQIISRTEFSMSPKFFGGLFAQWNDNDNQALLNFRLTWIPTIGTDFFFVFTQSFNTDQTIRSNGVSVLAKLVWRFII
ncbi:MAG: DUF5916 domain-containing protein [Chloroherpetonaceae bacterium]|nr:DUF5916 domain-containing protein [Chloroherpetonaceae bacterium]